MMKILSLTQSSGGSGPGCILFSMEYSFGSSESLQQRLHVLGILVALDIKRSKQISHKTFCKADIAE